MQGQIDLLPEWIPIINRRFALENRIATLVVTSVLAAIVLSTAVALLPLPDWRYKAGGSLMIFVLLSVHAWRASRNILQPLRSLSSVLEAVKEEDYGLRARRDRGGVLAELAYEINVLAETRRDQARLVEESRALLEKILSSMDLPLLAFADDSTLILANRSADELLGTRLKTGIHAESLGIRNLLEDQLDNPVTLVLPGGSGRYVVTRRTFRMDGKPHQLILLAEVEAALRAERQEAWESLVRVLAHEINNSLTPIKSIAETLHSISTRNDDNQGKVTVDSVLFKNQLQRIADRADSLGRFVAGYASLAKLPAPQIHAFALDKMIRNIARFESRVDITVQGEPVYLNADPDLLEQALINLLKNAVDFAFDPDYSQKMPQVIVNWQRKMHQDRLGILIEVSDNGPGPPESDNLFVPFFTTKPEGSGIGLLLARRIAELHDGTLTLEPAETDGHGAIARLWLPST